VTGREIVAAWVQAINDRDFDAFDALMAAGYVNHHLPHGQEDGVPGVKRFFAAMCAAIEGFHYDIAALEDEGDGIVRVVLRGHGRLVAQLAGVAAAAGPVSVSVTHRYRVAGGRIAERWGDPADPFRVEPAAEVA
jgi:predicted ester cyclase